MLEIMLLTFRWGNEKYGIPLEYVNGLTGNIVASEIITIGKPREIIELPQKPLIVFEMSSLSNTAGTRQAILICSNGLQLSLIVDEILKIENIKLNNPRAKVLAFELYHLLDNKE